MWVKTPRGPSKAPQVIHLNPKVNIPTCWKHEGMKIFPSLPSHGLPCFFGSPLSRLCPASESFYLWTWYLQSVFVPEYSTSGGFNPHISGVFGDHPENHQRSPELLWFRPATLEVHWTLHHRRWSLVGLRKYVGNFRGNWASPLTYMLPSGNLT